VQIYSNLVRHAQARYTGAGEVNFKAVFFQKDAFPTGKAKGSLADVAGIVHWCGGRIWPERVGKTTLGSRWRDGAAAWAAGRVRSTSQNGNIP